jgi:D-alanyl-D-alanine carboxypeptidase (penicillin-binding protein 5/6)
MFKNLFLVLFAGFIYVGSAIADLDVKARTAILQDYYSGEILYEKEPDISIYPASMTKIMTSIIAFDLIKSGDLKLDEKFIISEKHGVYQHQVTHQCLLWWVMKFL